MEDRTTTERIRLAQPFNNESIEKNIIFVLRSRQFVQGRFVKEFENELAKFIGCKNVVAVSSGTAALHVAFEVLKLETTAESISAVPEVITSPLSFAATANSVIQAGLKPVFSDVNEDTFNLDPELIESKISNQTIAVEPVDVYGLTADLGKINDIARKNNLKVVEDAAEAIGADYKGKKVGNFADISCFSTYATKNLHTGEGGFLTTNDDKIAESGRVIRNQGQPERYLQTLMGYNYRMQEISAVIGLEQIPKLDWMNKKRRENAHLLMDELSPLACFSFQKVDSETAHSWYLFSGRIDQKKTDLRRDEFVSSLRKNGVDADIAWPRPIHLQPYYVKKYGYREGDYPVAESICKDVFQLPVHPFLSDEQIRKICNTVKQIVRNQ